MHLTENENCCMLNKFRETSVDGFIYNCVMITILDPERNYGPKPFEWSQPLAYIQRSLFGKLVKVCRFYEYISSCL